jgi:hypothetical protein
MGEDLEELFPAGVVEAVSLSRKSRIDRLWRAMREHRAHCTECWNACGPRFYCRVGRRIWNLRERAWNLYQRSAS